MTLMQSQCNAICCRGIKLRNLWAKAKMNFKIKNLNGKAKNEYDYLLLLSVLSSAQTKIYCKRIRFILRILIYLKYIVANDKMSAEQWE